MGRELKIAVFGLVLCCGAALRVWVSTLGWNYDLESWWIVANLVNEGKNVYTHTLRFNSGPIWGYIAWLTLQIQQALGLTGMTSFHVLVAGFLTIADIGIAITLARAFGFLPAALFALCPVSILITGYHSQMDNVAILFALWSWRSIEDRFKGDGAPTDLIWPAVLMGLSLATKHVFVFFPLWILVWPSGRLRDRLLYSGIAYAIFLSAFIPFVLTPVELGSVIRNVFLYRGWGYFGNALLPRIIRSEMLWTGAFVAGMVATGFVIARWAPRELFFLYPVALLTFTTTLTDQYLVIPIISFAAYWKHLAMWAYVGTATAALLASPGNVGSLGALQSIAEPLRAGRFILRPDPQSTLLAQICLLLFLLSWLITYSRRHPITRPRNSE